MDNPEICVIIPAYRARDTIVEVVDRVAAQAVDTIIVIDDGCPDGTGKHLLEHCSDERLQVIFHQTNQGVGAAMISGFQAALHTSCDVIVKLDSDLQMDPELIPVIISPIAYGEADYTKGNRFFFAERLMDMPVARLIGNVGLSFITRVSTGYWDISDPTNGFIAVHRRVLEWLPLDKLSRGYFFESDMIFHMSLLRAVIVEIPMRPQYGLERSNLSIVHALVTFPFYHFVRFIKRFFLLYLLREVNIGTIHTVAGLLFLTFGFVFGALEWAKSMATGIPSTSGTVMLASLPIIVGFISLISAVNFDITNSPKTPLHRRIKNVEAYRENPNGSKVRSRDVHERNNN